MSVRFVLSVFGGTPSGNPDALYSMQADSCRRLLQLFNLLVK